MNPPAQNISVPKRKRRKAVKAFRILLWTAAAGLALILIWCGSLYARITIFQNAAWSSERMDAAIVLGASLWNDRPSPGLQERLDHALDLYQDGRFDYIIVSGGLDKGATVTEAEGMRDYLLEQGVPAEIIRIEPESRSTYENLKFSKQIMEAEGWNSAVIVTHSYHGARAADIARTLGYDPVSVSTTESKVMNMSYHKTREVLAFAKWQMTKLRLALAGGE